MFLNSVESLMNCTAKPRGDHRQSNHRHERDERQPPAYPDHEEESEGATRDCVDGVHDRRTRSHSHCAEVVRETSHDVAGSRARVVLRVECLELLEKNAAQIVFYLATDAV